MCALLPGINFREKEEVFNKCAIEINENKTNMNGHVMLIEFITVPGVVTFVAGNRRDDKSKGLWLRVL